MAKPRHVDPTGFVHLNSRGNFRRRIYEDPDEFRYFLTLYERVALAHGWVTLSYCLMTNHYHFVVRLTDDGLSHGMQQLNGNFSRRMNAIHGRTNTGHLFKNRFHSEPITRQEHLREACRYDVLNPVTAGVCGRAEDWPWSSYLACAGLAPAPRFLAVDELLTLFGPTPAAARAAYRAFVAEGAQSRHLGQTTVAAA
jgi:REP element-mobilizing transposase RayT